MPVEKKVSSRLRILDNLFRRQVGVSYRQIQEILAAEGYAVSVRTIQNDIDVLKKDYGATFREGRSGHQILLRYQDITKSALASDASKTLINEAREKLEKELFSPHLLFAASMLEHLAEGNPVRQFIDAVDFDYNGDLTGIEYFPDLLRAIINRTCISYTYKPFNADPLSVTVSPILLKNYNQRWYLICMSMVDGRYYINALDRIQEIVFADDIPFKEPDYDYVRDCLAHTFGVGKAFTDDIPTEQVVLKVSSKYYPYLETKPFPEQEARKEGEYYIVSFKLKINKELKNRILALGPEAEVLAPIALRDDISLIINTMRDSYAKITK
jgi:predicted DNA-binding transcriptional regulator YafY